MVFAWGTLEPDARSDTNPCEMWGTTQGAAKGMNFKHTNKVT